MAGGMDLGTGGKGGKKQLDTTINLVPFIDLMAVTIVFLIMTAVWTQLGRLQVSQPAQSASEEEEPEDRSLLQPVTLLVTEKELRLSMGGTQFDPIPIIRNAKGLVDVKLLTSKLKELKTQQPEQNTITVATEDAVKYHDLVRLIDTCIGGEFPSVTVSPASS